MILRKEGIDPSSPNIGILFARRMMTNGETLAASGLYNHARIDILGLLRGGMYHYTSGRLGFGTCG